MRVVRPVALLTLVMLFGACADKHPAERRIPPPTEAAPIGDVLRERVHRHEAALRRDGLAKTRPALERMLADIAREYGEKSVEVPQSITEVALMIMSEDDAYAEALPYLARALEASVAVYGAEHRETAFAVHDYAYAQVLASPGKYVPEATPLLERALAIRLRLLGADAPETAGSESSLADQLVAQCHSKPPCAPGHPLLARAAQLAEHSRGIIGDSRSEIVGKISVANAEGSASTCGNSSRPEKLDDLSWVHTDAKLYRLTPEGEFSVGGFDRRPSKLIGKHVFESSVAPEIWVSADGRWIAYGGHVPGDGTGEIWLFDTRNQKERRVAITPKFHTSAPEFSPSGSMLAYFASYDDRWTRKQGMGLYLIEAKSGRNIFVGYPADTAIDALLGSGFVEWSADGSSVLLHLVGHPHDKFTREFHRFDLKARTFRKIDGNYDHTIRNGAEYLEGGKTIVTHANPVVSTSAWYRQLQSASGGWRAYIDGQHRLLVQNKDRGEHVVDLGGYNDCEGETIGITGWVDGDRYLVYRKESRQIIYDPVIRRRAVLFSLEEGASTFTW